MISHEKLMSTALVSSPDGKIFTADGTVVARFVPDEWEPLLTVSPQLYQMVSRCKDQFETLAQAFDDIGNYETANGLTEFAATCDALIKMSRKNIFDA